MPTNLPRNCKQMFCQPSPAQSATWLRSLTPTSPSALPAVKQPSLILTVDYGDLKLIQAGLYGAEYLIYTLNDQESRRSIDRHPRALHQWNVVSRTGFEQLSSTAYLFDDERFASRARRFHQRCELLYDCLRVYSRPPTGRSAIVQLRQSISARRSRFLFRAHKLGKFIGGGASAFSKNKPDGELCKEF